MAETINALLKLLQAASLLSLEQFCWNRYDSTFILMRKVVEDNQIIFHININGQVEMKFTQYLLYPMHQHSGIPITHKKVNYREFLEDIKDSALYATTLSNCILKIANLTTDWTITRY